MNHRERFIQTLVFGQPDRIPLNPGEPRESTLEAWHRQGLAPGVDWREQLCKTIGVGRDAFGQNETLDADFRMIPWFEEKVLEHKQGHLIVQDWKGNVCEIADHFDVTYLREPKDFVTRAWLRCPVENREDWERMKPRYVAGANERLPAGFAEKCTGLRNREHVLGISLSGPFWQMREWCGFEGLCFLLLDEPDFVAEMAKFWEEFVYAVMARVLEHIVPDVVVINEDMAYKAKAMISPAMAREYCQPSWRRWNEQLKTAGCPVVSVDSDGCVDALIPLWIEAGVNCCEPMEVAAHTDLPALRKQFGRRMAYRGGVDKRCMAKGGQVIRDELARLEPVIQDGGYIPACDHGVPADVSWPDYVEYSRLLAKMTGWI